jgi:hypothetical protein
MYCHFYESMHDENKGFCIRWLDLSTLRNSTYYRNIADLHNLQFTVAHTLGFSVFTSHLLTMDLNTETSTSNHYEIFLPFLVQWPWNFRTQLKTLLGSLSCKQFVLYSCDMDNAENTVLLLHNADHTGNTSTLGMWRRCTCGQVCLPSHWLEAGCITPLFHCCVHVLLINSCFCGSTVLAQSKYATVYPSNYKSLDMHSSVCGTEGDTYMQKCHPPCKNYNRIDAV